MATQSAKAGKYELLVDQFDLYEKDGSRTTYTKGDIVQLDAEQAERLVNSTPPAVGEPGAAAQAEAERLQALADTAKAQADDAKARAAEAAKDVKAS